MMISLREVYLSLLENKLGLPEPSTAKQATFQDIEDALQHGGMMGDEERQLRIQDFTITNKVMPMKEIANYDDFSSWTEWKEGELAEMDEDERWQAINQYRGSAWANNATKWIETGKWPTIVIVELKDGSTFIGDGRGRVSLALGLGISKLPVSYLKEKL